MAQKQVVTVDQTLLYNCLRAFDELPNSKLTNGVKTYDLACQLDRILVRTLDPIAFSDMTARQQDQARARFLDAGSGDGYWYELGRYNDVISRNRNG